MAVVKANAYGHGAIETSRTLIRHRVTRLAVFSTEEGVALRQAGITVPIVVLGPLFQEQFDDLFAHQLTPVVSDPSVLTALGQAAASHATPYPIHLKIETGMGRLGLTHDQLEALINSRRFPASLQFTWKVVLPGYLPGWIYDQEVLDTSLPFAELQKRSQINQRGQAADKDPIFSLRIREGLPKPAPRS